MEQEIYSNLNHITHIVVIDKTESGNFEFKPATKKTIFSKEKKDRIEGYMSMCDIDDLTFKDFLEEYSLLFINKVVYNKPKIKIWFDDSSPITYYSSTFEKAITYRDRVLSLMKPENKMYQLKLV